MYLYAMFSLSVSLSVSTVRVTVRVHCPCHCPCPLSFSELSPQDKKDYFILTKGEITNFELAICKINAGSGLETGGSNRQS